MKSLIKLEELAQLILAVLILFTLDAKWWWYIFIFIGPDISMIGYLLSPKIGAVSYNVFHHKGIAILVLLTGFYFQNNLLLLFGAALFGHSALDRLFGYGLKFSDSFQNTHLGLIGKKSG